MFSSHSTLDPWALSRWLTAAYLSIGAAMLAVLGMAAWGIHEDLDLVHTTLIQSRTNRLRLHGMRTVTLLQDELRKTSDLTELSSSDRDELAHKLRTRWDGGLFQDESHAYACVTDLTGTIIFHSHPDREGLKLGPVWYDHVVEEGGDNVVETHDPALTGGSRYLDVRLPIVVDQKDVGLYHAGFSGDWLGKNLAKMQHSTWERWAILLTCMMLVVLMAGVSLFYISRRATMYGEAVKLARARRFAELGQLMAGIVHEIRNPLNAMRLNLHVLRSYEKRSEADEPTEEASFATDPLTIIDETNREIARIEELMRILLGYARPDRVCEQELELGSEIQSMLDFLGRNMEKAGVAVHLHVMSTPLIVRIDRDRFRQMILNLVNNARDATGPGGAIHVRLNAAENNTVELSVSDNGPGVPAADRERIFEPFYSTKELATGLGLPLVKRFVEEAGGDIVCQDNLPRGAKFLIHFREAPVGTPGRTNGAAV